MLDQIDSSVFPCVIFGTGANARHFPAETLIVVPEQPLKGKTPSSAVSVMIDNAREMPGMSRREISTNARTLLELNHSSFLVGFI